MTKLPPLLINPLRSFIRKLIGPITNRLVLFEGGLGSQIISYMLVDTLLAQGKRPIVDFSYFDDEITDSNLSQWKWELSSFGIDEVKYRIQFKIGPGDRFLLSLIKATRGFSGRSKNEAQLIQKCDLESISRELSIPEGTHSALEELALKPFQYSMVHIRKGDFLKVSSRVISASETLEALKKFRNLNFGNTILVTDGEFSEEEIQAIYSSSIFNSIILLENNKYTNHTLHGMMRLSRILVTSNSTFSWTAGLLNRHPESIVLSPTHFFRNPLNDELFQTTSSWMVMN